MKLFKQVDYNEKMGKPDGYYKEVGTIEDIEIKAVKKALKKVREMAKFVDDSGTKARDFVIWLDAYIREFE